MKKSENTKDLNTSREQALDSPLSNLLHKTWKEFDETINYPNLSKEDILRYLLWSLENIKESDDIDNSCSDLRYSVKRLLRENGIPSAEINYIANALCAYLLICLDEAFMYSKSKVMLRVCTIAENSIKAEFKEIILDHKKLIKKKLNLLPEDKDNFQEWCSNFLQNDTFYTTEDAEWMEYDPLQVDLKIGEKAEEHTFELTTEEWCQRYGKEIKSIFKKKEGEKENTGLIIHVNKLREKYVKELNLHPNPNARWRTPFLRNNVFYPEKKWLEDFYSISEHAIHSLFGDEKFTQNVISNAKKE